MASSDSLDPKSVIDLLNSTSQGVNDLMKQYADEYAARADRLSAVRDRIQKSANPPADQLAALSEAITQADTLARNLKSIATRVAGKPAVGPEDLAATGRVVDASGAGIAKVSVRLTDQAGVLNVGQAVQTGPGGDFSLVFKPCEIPSPPPTLILAVEDAAGKRVGVSDPVTLQPASPLYLEIGLTNPQAPAAGPAAKSGPPVEPK